ncbi:hypothetical protein ACN28S_38135 [Cystobacter fuscus]
MEAPVAAAARAAVTHAITSSRAGMSLTQSASIRRSSTPWSFAWARTAPQRTRQFGSPSAERSAAWAAGSGVPASSRSQPSARPEVRQVRQTRARRVGSCTWRWQAVQHPVAPWEPG